MPPQTRDRKALFLELLLAVSHKFALEVTPNLILVLEQVLDLQL